MPKAQASEVSYELHSLGWKSFQNLCVTIAGEIWGQTVQSFHDSNDAGRDGAFYGTWAAPEGNVLSGSFTIQCKFTAKPGKTFCAADLSDEMEKARMLAERGVADNYFLFTNASLTGSNEQKLKALFENIPGVQHFAAYGGERISQIIHGSARLRMLVPRVYGLGDLSQILDERAYAQGREILSALGDDFPKFVITEAYRRSAKALVDHGFVLLLGEPACGKSTIAAALSMGALDQWKCFTIKARNADDFHRHWNPNEPNQLFWVDDAFGATQFDWDAVSSWNQTFSHLNAAIKRGAKVIFTSRSYIYESAKRNLKESAFPLIRESQVIIEVEKLSMEEKEQILYNHVRLGTQPHEFKAAVKKLLPGVAQSQRFKPEIARRLGNPLFTKRMSWTVHGISDFVERPVDFLREIILTLDPEGRSAIALVFMRGGILPSPISISEEESSAIRRFGGDPAQVPAALTSLNGSLVSASREAGQNVWKLKHPTIRDAFAAHVAEDQELLDIYLAGTPLTTLLSEITCGDVGIEGVKVVLPLNRYQAILDRLVAYDTTKWENKNRLYRFFSYRCDKGFLEALIARDPGILSKLHVGSYLYAVADVALIIRLHDLGLLPEEIRVRSVSAIKRLAINTPDAGFLDRRFGKLIQVDEKAEILEAVRVELLPHLSDTIKEWEDSYEETSEDDPESHFDELKGALESYQAEFLEDEEASAQLDDAIEHIETVVKEIAQERMGKIDPGDFHEKDAPEYEDERVSVRSIFDDVDE